MPIIGGVGIDQGGGGGGISDHSDLNELDYSSSGHTGFAPTSHPHAPGDIIPQGTGSNFDADTVDGQHAVAFAAATHGHAESDVTNLVTDLAGKKKIFAPADLGAKIKADWNPALGVTYDGSNKVSHFIDQIGGLDFAQPTAGNQPSINLTYLNGKPAIIFSRTGNTYLKTTGLGTTFFGSGKPYQIFIVGKQLDSASGTLFAACDGVGPRMVIGFDGNGYMLFKELQTGVNREMDWIALTGATPTAQIISISKSLGTGQYATLRVDGKTLLDNVNFNAISAFVAPNLSLGCVNYGAGPTYTDSISFALCRLIVCTPLSNDETLAMEAYLAAEYGQSGASQIPYTPQTPIGMGRLTSYDYTVTDTDFLVDIAANARNVTCTLGRLSDMARYMRYTFRRYDDTTAGYYARIVPYGAEKIKFLGADLSSIDLIDQGDTLVLQWANSYWAVIAQTRHTPKTLGTMIDGLTAKTTPVDADMFGLMDSAAAKILKKFSWANIKTFFVALVNGYATLIAEKGVILNSLGSPFGFYIASATFNSVRDDALLWGYNLNPTINGTPQGWDTKATPTEPLFRHHVEAHVKTNGGDEQMEIVQDYISPTDTSCTRRVLQLFISRLTNFVNWWYTGNTFSWSKSTAYPIVESDPLFCIDVDKGKVGIGVAPAANGDRFAVVDNIAAGTFSAGNAPVKFTFSNQNTGAAGFAFYANSTPWQVVNMGAENTPYNRYAIWNNSGVEVFTILQTGEVGVNTKDPLAKLDIVQTTANAYILRIGQAATNYGWTFRRNNSTGALEIQGEHTGYSDIALCPSSGSVVVGASDAVASALLELVSTTQGLLPPRMTTTQRTAISSPAEGLAVYDTDLHKLYCYDGSTWQAAW